jgi:Na+-transporting NADH:ubiquinone oxidoreductase subunit C
MNEKFKNLIFILILGSISTALLLGLRAYTLPQIERYQERQLKSAILEAAGEEYEAEYLEGTFARKIRKREDKIIYYLSREDNYIYEFEGRGLWGMIRGLVTIKPDLETIENVKIIAQEETPGLGGRIAEDEFLGQFRNKKVSPRLGLSMRGKAAGASEVDAISGASISSKALIEIINDSVEELRREIKRDK